MNAREILIYLHMVANNNLIINVTMHIVAIMALAAILIITKEDLKRVIFYITISILFLSVTINALFHGNPFHAVTFGILTLTSIIELYKNKSNIRMTNNGMNRAVGFLFIFIGLWYPEFVDKKILMLLLVSPVGIIPCPTLLTTLGLLTLMYQRGNRILCGMISLMGMIYALIGVFVLKVYLDISLLLLVLYVIYYLVWDRRNGKYSINSNQI